MAERHAVVHLFFGRLPNHVAVQHFAQHSTHFDYSPRAPEPLLAHDVDWATGATLRGDETYVPRALCFDSRIGCSAGAGGAYDWAAEPGADEQHALAREGQATWGQEAVVQRVGASASETDTAEDDLDDDAEPDEAEEDVNELADDAGAQSAAKKPARQRPSPRPWSHYATFDFHPRSLVALRAPGGGGDLRALEDLSGGASAVGDGATELGAWETGIAAAQELDSEIPFLDELLRPWTEACDAIQAFSSGATTTDAFAGLSHWTLEQIVDEYPKTTMLTWGAAGVGATGLQDERKEHARRLRAINSALSLAMLSEVSSLYMPLQCPSRDAFHDDVLRRRAEWQDPRTQASILQPTLDTALLGLRLKSGGESASTLASRLNWRRDTPISALRGHVPLPSLSSAPQQQPMDPIDALLASRGYGPARSKARPLTRDEAAVAGASILKARCIDFSGLAAADCEQKAFAASTVARGAAAAALGEKLEDAVDKWSDVDAPFGQYTGSSVPYNVSSTFPPIFNSTEQDASPLQLSLLASISTTPATAAPLRAALSSLKEALQGHLPSAAWGIAEQGPLGGMDGLREARERLEELLGAYEEEGAGGELEDVGTDEEFEQDEWDL